MREAATALSDFLKNKGQQSDHATHASFQTVAVANSPRHATVKGEEQRQTLAGQRTATPTSQTVASLRSAVQSASLKFSNQLVRLPGWTKGAIGTVVVLLLIYSISLPFRADRKPVPDVPNLDPPTASAASQAKKPKLNALGQDPVKLEQYYVRNPAARPPTPVISDAPSPPEAPSTPAVAVPPSPAKAPFPSVQAKAHQQAWAKHLGADVETTNSIGMKMVLIPPGEFTMGSPARGNEKPQHLIRITKPFYLSVYEITQQQYAKVMGTRPWQGKQYVQDGPDNPATYVSWHDAVEFCRKLSQQEGVEYRLPTEAQWEYACRAGTTTAYSFGDDVSQLGQYAWYLKNAWDSGEKYAHGVGQKLPNRWGLFDMHGNVWEWCQDWNAPYGSKKALTDPLGPAQGNSRVLRGGSFHLGSQFARSANRNDNNPGNRSVSNGFRVARTYNLSPLPAKPPGSKKVAAVKPKKNGAAKPPVPPPAPPLAKAPFNDVKAKAHQQAWAKHLGAKDETNNSVGMKLKLIPPGEFTMGSNYRADEKPPHKVTLTKPFELGVYEVTQEQYEKVMGVMGTNPSKFKAPQNPVEQVSWTDAVEFCRKLSSLPEEKAAGYVYRLPTEAEWEYACRAGTKTKYSFGDSESELGDYAWYTKNSGRTTHSVGRKKPNPWGLYDMHGNVWEWCQDRYGNYPSGSVTDPTGAASGSFRVSRGGCWSLNSDLCHSASRDRHSPGHRTFILGFRVLRSSIK
jgi:formylglycine-generating enzyme required for sulfatase activity